MKGCIMEEVPVEERRAPLKNNCLQKRDLPSFPSRNILKAIRETYEQKSIEVYDGTSHIIKA